MVDSLAPNNLLERRLHPLLKTLYTPEQVDWLMAEIMTLVQAHLAPTQAEDLHKWSQNNALLITYGDSIRAAAPERPLVTLRHFLSEFWQDVVTGVHILPFNPYSSDDGFAVKDYLTVNPELGTWQDLGAIAAQFNLMVDLVINHVSSEHIWFEQFKQGQPPGRDYFIEVDPQTDLSQVVRPRSSPLLAPVETVHGEKHLWATFSHDQIDVNFANPAVLLEFIKIILFYENRGAKYFRLDAIGYLWKQIGTPCIHLPQTHTVIRLLREILQMINPGIALITETNVPNRENLSYFGNRNEAHLIYNFSLPPLVLNALLQGRSDHLKTWMMSMPPAPLGCAYLNFTASHDGIGLRPTEGLLTDDEYQALLRCMQDFGGIISMRTQADGSESPYEVNISFFDALKGTAQGIDEWQIERFLCSQTIMMSLEGIPAFYIHSLLATPNDWDGVKRTGRNRSINRYSWSDTQLRQALADPTLPHGKVLHELSRRIRLRRQQPSFHPNATQYTLHPLNSALFAFWRQSMARDQSIFCVHNLSNQPQKLSLSNLNLVITDDWYDLLSGDPIFDLYDTLLLRPYQCVWITNQPLLTD
ncbi:alpha-amylase [Synechococcales cyanobacterium C]|uniref:Alpha-amylase n=1 Tax=Petrachloros mirabilis ULC683 TaxID=2781853 RepID=A0A8K1ZW88_9CYAN|nr:alpha-amylase family glycosyl hydrolase [Petrachloros mirabilis]NCJ05281.1 alpha-amylase [Petrachloros mirabilis ULC683]